MKASPESQSATNTKLGHQETNRHSRNVGASSVPARPIIRGIQGIPNSNPARIPSRDSNTTAKYPKILLPCPFLVWRGNAMRDVGTPGRPNLLWTCHDLSPTSRGAKDVLSLEWLALLHLITRLLSRAPCRRNLSLASFDTAFCHGCISIGMLPDIPSAVVGKVVAKGKVELLFQNFLANTSLTSNCNSLIIC